MYPPARVDPAEAIEQGSRKPRDTLFPEHAAKGSHGRVIDVGKRDDVCARGKPCVCRRPAHDNPYPRDAIGVPEKRLHSLSDDRGYSARQEMVVKNHEIDWACHDSNHRVSRLPVRVSIQKACPSGDGAVLCQGASASTYPASCGTRYSESYRSFSPRWPGSFEVGASAGAARAAQVDASSYVSRIVADAILLNEIPSPTEREAARTQHIQQRLIELGYPGCSLDEHGNVSAVLPGARSERRARAAFRGHQVRGLLTDREHDEAGAGPAAREGNRGELDRGRSPPGPGGIPCQQWDPVRAKRDVSFTSFDPGEREPQPLERFLQVWKDRVRLAAHVSGLELGRLEERPLGTCKLSVAVRTEEREPGGREPPPSVIWALASMASRLGSIRWDTENNTFLNVARFDAGVGFGWPATEGVLELEVLAERSFPGDGAQGRRGDHREHRRGGGRGGRHSGEGLSPRRRY